MVNYSADYSDDYDIAGGIVYELAYDLGTVQILPSVIETVQVLPSLIETVQITLDVDETVQIGSA